MTSNFKESMARGNEHSPILFIGHSLSNNKNVREKLREILDRRHIVFNSIIIPIIYYMNEYFEYSKCNFRLPNGFKHKQFINDWSINDSDNDIFRYINAFIFTEDSEVINDNRNYIIREEITEKKSGIKKEIVKVRNDQQLKNEIDNSKNRIILCMGTKVFFAIKDLLTREYSIDGLTVSEAEKYFSKGNRNREKKGLGIYFSEYIKRYKEQGLLQMPHGGKVIILPILHNSSNLAFSDSDIFFASSNKNYVVYFQYIAEEVGEILRNMYINKDIDENYASEMITLTNN